MESKVKKLLFAAEYMRQYVYSDEHRNKAYKKLDEAIDEFANEKIELGICTIRASLHDVLEEEPGDLGTREMLKALNTVFQYWLDHHRET